VLASLYFLLCAGLTLTAIYTTGRPSTGSPLLVSLATIAYGALLPGAMVSALASGLVFYSYNSLFSSINSSMVAGTDFASTFGILALVLLDLCVNRQPYYATYHGLWGCLFCWGYIIFTIVAYFLNVTDAVGHRYVYPYLAWGVPLKGGGPVTGAKLLLCNIFLLVPVFNLLYWFLLWARRRVHVSTKQLELGM